MGYSLYEGTYGVKLYFAIVDSDGEPVDLSGATCSLFAMTPNGDGSEEPWTVSISPPNYLVYENDVNSKFKAGEYSVQPHLSLPGGFNGRWGRVTFTVDKKYKVQG